ncbi:hypothetical protein NP233_g5927 [Leucocoprinus birnbaumii]|uniref:Xylanolytic transcriptional activator regulatory domain-containing protein n=1 Tax=Leucocoprinus birnbaumii TaxID=56174 RepID=A0AAD5VXX8_9AGAR|nr:hypothetical protein NP233_g5927 [Leucocoprinus birnbaumii]
MFIILTPPSALHVQELSMHTLCATSDQRKETYGRQSTKKSQLRELKCPVSDHFSQTVGPYNLSPNRVSKIHSIIRLSPPSEQPSPTSFFASNSLPQPLFVRYGLHPGITLSTPTREVLKFVFAAPENTNEPTPYTSPTLIKSPYETWGELAHKLDDDKFKAEFALDLVEVFFQIVHTRLPLLNPAQFRNRLQLNPAIISSSSNSEKPLHPALVATVLAWGSKFSEHPLLVADRRRPGGQSLLAKALIDRARDLAEALKVHRVASAEHVVIGLLIEPLQSQNPEDPTGYHGFWLTSATRHLLELGINQKAVMGNIQDPESRGTMIFAWWMACISDAYASAYYRRKPVLDDHDYDIDFYTVDPVNPDLVDTHTAMPSPREQLEFLGYYRAAHSLARTARHMSKQLWRPSTDSDGVPYENLCVFVQELVSWRDDFLNLVGVPSNFEGEWDFVSAVSSCASDATYHLMWIILFNALDDYGIKELNAAMTPPNPAEIESTKRKVADEALHGALRIAGLAGVLTSNGYLRLDPAVMHVSCIQAGTLLARLGRPEVQNCIAGLEQYSYSYEEAGDQATEMRRVYNATRLGQSELNHMASVTHRITPTPPPQHGNQYEDQVMSNGSSPQHHSPHYHHSRIHHSPHDVSTP